MSAASPRGGLARAPLALAAFTAFALAACAAGASPSTGSPAPGTGSPASSPSGATSPSGAAGPSPSATAVALEGPTWQLTGYEGPNGGTLPVPGAVAATATFSSGTLSGNAGCNAYNATYTVDGVTLTIGRVTSTAMTCGPVASALEKTFLAALGRVASYAISGDALELRTATGKVGLTFAAAKAPALVGTRWVANSINTGTGATSSVVAGTTVTAIFGPDGKVAGSGGCNDFSGSYTTSGSTMAIGDLRSTKMACVDATASQQEAAYLEALGKVAAFGFDGDQLQLRDASGALLVRYQPTLPK